MWKKLISADGQWWIIEHRTWSANGPKTEKTFIGVNDPDFEECQKFCESKGL